MTAKSSPFDATTLATWLQEVAGTHGPVNLERIGSGQSNLTYTATDAHGRVVVVRRPPLGQLAANAHDVVREGRIMAALEGTDVPVPHIYGHTTLGDVPVVAMSAVEGVTMNSTSVAEAVTPQVRRTIANGLIDSMVAIHNVDLVATGLDDLASHKPYAPRQLRRWAGQWEKTKTRELSALDELTALLERAQPHPDGDGNLGGRGGSSHSYETTLVHGDLHLGNVIADPQTGAVNAVVDWELTTLGDPLADIGSLLAYWPTPEGLKLPGFEAALAEGFPTPDELAERYLTLTGRSEDSLGPLGFWHVLGLWKVAIIVEGVVRRVQNNPSNRAVTGAPTPEMVEWIVGYAHTMASRYGLSS